MISEYTKIELDSNNEFSDKIDKIRKEYLYDLSKLRRKYLRKFQKEIVQAKQINLN